MQITTFSDYCLRISIFLAVSDGRKTTAGEIAERYNISTHHVAKASQWLVREGHVSAMRGGLRLARNPGEIRIGSVIRKAEAGTGLVECMRGTEAGCAIATACGLSSILDEARDAILTPWTNIPWPTRHNEGRVLPDRCSWRRRNRPEPHADRNAYTERNHVFCQEIDNSGRRSIPVCPA